MIGADLLLEEEIMSLVNENIVLREAIIKTIEENKHLADGENCTLIHLTRALKY